MLAKGFVAELATLHVQSAWEFRGERVRAVGLVVCCNDFSKKTIKDSITNCSVTFHIYQFWHINIPNILKI